MKRLFVLGLGILMICGVLGFSSQQLNHAEGYDGDNTLNFYNWGSYIDPALIKKFEQQTGYKVTYETFDSNEAMETKIKQGGTSYDLTVPSDYMIAKMKKEHMLLPIDHHQLKGFNGIDQKFRNQSFDPGNRYSIPYFWGTLGIIYNDQDVKPGAIQHWQDLWAPKYKDSIMLVDSARDMMGMALIKDGYSVNSTSVAQLNEAKNSLDQLSGNVKAVVSDEIKMYMIQNEASIAVTWSGEASEMLEGNKHLHYVVPSEGSNLWFDNLVIPKTAKHFKAIYAFLNFMLEPANAAQNAEYIGYATPITKAKAMLPKEVREDQQFYPPSSTIDKLEVYQDLSPKYVGLYNDLFLEFKMFGH